jgi:hypothetical protein
MKKVILTTIVFAILINNSKAQEVPKKDGGFRTQTLVGIKIGTNYSNVYDNNDASFKTSSKFGSAFGAYLSLPISKLIGIQSELLFSQKGFKATGNMSGSTYDLKRTSNFLDMPILLAVKPSELFTLMAGPQFSYLLTQNDEFSNTIMTKQQQNTFSNDYASKHIISAVVGLNVNVKTTMLGLRAAWDLQNNNGQGATTVPRYKNMWYQATIGFRIL